MTTPKRFYSSLFVALGVMLPIALVLILACVLYLLVRWAS